MSLHRLFIQVQERLNCKIIGQQDLTLRLLISILADGHLLVEGAPGLAKTTAIKVLSDCLEGNFHRIQFTPDLLPADLTGTEIYRPQDGSFHFQQGPLFHNLLLADEINRAPAKVQSALLEAMGERQITVGKMTYKLPELFLVMATQNPIEQEGTYPLPEAQLDRFLMQVFVEYPDMAAEKKILALVREQASMPADKEPEQNNVRLGLADVYAARKEVLDIHIAESLEDYIIQIIFATRFPQKWGDGLSQWIRYGASPRGSIALDRCAKSLAWLKGNDFVSPDDIQTVAYDVLRHRILLTFEAEAHDVQADDVIKEILDRVPVP